MEEQIIENQISQQVVEQVPVIVQEKKKSNTKLFIIISFIAISLITVGVYAGMQISKKQTQVVIPTAPPQNIRPTEAVPTSIPDETANWKTYKNDSLGIEFKFPETFAVQEKSGEITVWKDKNQPTLIPGNPFNSAIFFQAKIENLNGKSFEQYIQDKFSFPKNKSLTVFLSENKWEYSWKKPDTWFYFHNAEGPGDGTFNNYLIGKDKVIEITAFLGETVKNKQFDQILSTFKFIDSNSTTQPVEPDGKQIGFIQKAYYQSGQQYIDIDYIEWLNGAEGEKACIEDKKCATDCSQVHCLSNGYYIRNNNSKIRTLAVDINSAIKILYNTSNGDIQSKSVDFSTFQKSISDNITKYGADYNLFEITISNGTVVNLSEKYRP